MNNIIQDPYSGEGIFIEDASNTSMATVSVHNSFITNESPAEFCCNGAEILTNMTDLNCSKWFCVISRLFTCPQVIQLADTKDAQEPQLIHVFVVPVGRAQMVGKALTAILVCVFAWSNTEPLLLCHSSAHSPRWSAR